MASKPIQKKKVKPTLTCRAILLCDEVIRDELSHKSSVIGDWTGTTNSATVAVVPIHFVALNPPEPIISAGETPNAVTIQTMKDVLAGKNVVRCENAKGMFRELGI